MTESRPHTGISLTDDEALWFPAHLSAGDSFLRVTRPDGTPEPEDDGIGLPNRRPPKGGRRKPPGKGGIKAVSWLWVALWGTAAVGIVAVAARKEIAAEMTQAWLKGQGVTAKVKYDKLSLSDVSGTILVGDAANPDVSVEHFDADYSLNLFAGHGQPLARLKNLHAVHPLVAVALKNGKLSFGSLNKLIQDSLNAPPSGEPAHSIVLDDATLLLQTDYGLVRARANVSLQDGQIHFLSVKLPASEFNGPQGAGEISGGTITAKALPGDQLEVHAVVDATNWDVRGARDNAVEDGPSRQDLHVQGLTVSLDGHVPYRKGVAGLAAFTGAVQGTLAVRADGVQSQFAYVNGLEANLKLDGKLKSGKDASEYEGVARLLSRADSLASGDIDSRNIKLDGPALGLRARYGFADGLSLAVGGALSGDVGLLRQDDLFLKAAHLNIAALSMTADASGSHSDFKGAVTASRAAAADLSLDAARVAFSGDAGSDAGAGSWAVNLTSDISSDQGQYTGLRALADERRNSPKAPNPDHIVALDRAFQRFSLRARGLKVTLGGQGGTLRYDVRLPGTLDVGLNGGGKVVLTPEAAKPLIATGEKGGFAVALSGPDLPTVKLAVTQFGYADPRNPFALSGVYTLTGQVTTDPVAGATFDAHGHFATTANNAFNVALDAPARVVLKSAELGDHIEAVSATIAQRDGAIFRATPSGWRISGVYSDLALTAPNEGLTLAAGQGTFDVFSQGASPALGLKMAMSSATLADALPAAQARFNPLLMSGTLSQDTRALTGRFVASTPNIRLKNGDATPIGTINLDNDVATGKGSLSFVTVGLKFDPAALQPKHLSPQLHAVMTDNVTGTATFGGAFQWDKTTTTSQGVLKVDGLNFRGGMGVARNLSGQIVFTSLAPLRTDPGQVMTLEHLSAAVPLDNFAVSVQFLGDHIAIERADVLTPGGKVMLEPTSVPLDGKSPISGALAFNGLDFGKVVAATSLAQNMTFKGNLTGRIPFTIIGGQVTFAQGAVAADAPGQISIKRSSLTDVSASGSLSAENGAKAGEAQTAFNPFQDLAFQAMEHISYDQLDAKINSLPDGRVDVNFHIKGHFDPPKKQKATISIGDYLSGKWMQKPITLPSDTPVELFLEMPVSLDGLFTGFGGPDVAAKLNETK